MPTPNIVFVHVDQMHHRAISALGNKHVKTPGFDTLMREGMHLSRVHASNPVCCPARSSWWTGRMSCEHRVIVNGVPMEHGMEDVATWLRSKAGYENIYAGKWHVPGRSVDRCFKVIRRGSGQGEYTDAVVTDTAVAYLRRRKPGKPLLMSVGLLNPQDCCYNAGALGGIGKYGYAASIRQELPPLPENFKVEQRQRRPSVEGWSDRDWQYYRYCYFRQVEMVDAQVARLYEAVRKMPDADNTLFLFASDHGDGLGYHGHTGKGYLEDEALRVPAIAVWPGRIKAGSKSDVLASQIDFAATFCDLAGVPQLPNTPIARSLLPALIDQKQEWRDHVVAENGIEVVIRDDRHKSYFDEKKGLHRLFDMQDDPLETRNLATGIDPAAVKERHWGWFRKYAGTVQLSKSDDGLKAAMNREHRGRMSTRPAGKIRKGVERLERVRRWYPKVAAGEIGVERD